MNIKDAARGKKGSYLIGDFEIDDHNMASNFGIAAQRSVEFFDRYLK